MRRFSWRRMALPILLTIGILGGSQRDASWASTHTGRAGAGASVTLSVYTCCGSLSGFAAKDNGLTDMHTLYARLWAHMFPSVGWQEISFTDQATLETRLAAAVKAGTPPDVVFIQGGDIGSAVLRGLVQPLDRYFARYHGAESNFLPGMARWAHFGGHWWAIPAVSGPLGGQQIYLPKYMAPLGFNNGNLHTFDDYYAMSEKAVRFDAEGRLTRIGYWPGADSWETTGTLMCSPGHGLYNADNQPTATDLCNVTYLGYLKKLADLYGGYAKLRTFLSGDPDPNFSLGDPKAYIATGKALIAPGAASFWNISPLDANSFGVKGGLSYQLTTLPPTIHGTQAEVATYPSTLQEVIIPRGARHPDVAFAVSKMMFWDDGYLLGRSLSGAPVAQTGEQQRWLGEAIAGEAAVRQQAGLPGNPAAGLVGIKMQPQLGQMSRASNPTNPVAPYYQQQLLAETARVLYGQESPQYALQQVQRRVLAQEQQLRARYGAWDW